MEIVHIAISDITPYEKNAKSHPKKQVDLLAENITRFGFTTPCLIDKDNNLIAGHGRLEAIKTLNWNEVPCVRMENLTEDEVKALRLADNKLAEMSEWDMSLVTDELKELDDDLLDLTGFDKDLIVEPDEADDEVLDVPEEPRSKLGDLYEMGGHRVLCGSATEMADVELALGGSTPDLVHTDPPYGMNAVTKSGVLSANYKIDILGDDNPDVAKDSFNLIYGLLPNAKHIWWGANYYSSVLPDSECWLVWDKNNGESDQTDCELAWANFRSVVRQFTQSSEKTNRVHPTQKPVSLMGWILKRFRLTADTVFDPFLGSGSTLIAAEKANCKCIGMELDPKYVDVIVQRYVDYVDNPMVYCNGEDVTKLWKKSEKNRITNTQEAKT